MEIISRVSKGSKMDQIYIPKNRTIFPVGEHVLILPLEREIGKKKATKPYFYRIKKLEPLKIRIIEEIFSLIGKKVKYENVIITGSFLEKGFNFNDIDILIVGEEKINVENLREIIEDLVGIKTHILSMSNKTLIKGLSTDPLYQLMLSQCISRNRLIYKTKSEINYKLLDLHLLKSKTLIDNFDILNGDEKYYLTRNMIAILLFLECKKISKESVDKMMEKTFKIDIEKIKQNLLDKKFLEKYEKIYNKTFRLIIKNIK